MHVYTEQKLKELLLERDNFEEIDRLLTNIGFRTSDPIGSTTLNFWGFAASFGSLAVIKHLVAKYQFEKHVDVSSPSAQYNPRVRHYQEEKTDKVKVEYFFYLAALRGGEFLQWVLNEGPNYGFNPLEKEPLHGNNFYLRLICLGKLSLENFKLLVAEAKHKEIDLNVPVNQDKDSFWRAAARYATQYIIEWILQCAVPYCPDLLRRSDFHDKNFFDIVNERFTEAKFPQLREQYLLWSYFCEGLVDKAWLDHAIKELTEKNPLFALNCLAYGIIDKCPVIFSGLDDWQKKTQTMRADRKEFALNYLVEEVIRKHSPDEKGTPYMARQGEQERLAQLLIAEPVKQYFLKLEKGLFLSNVPAQLIAYANWLKAVVEVKPEALDCLIEVVIKLYNLPRAHGSDPASRFKQIEIYHTKIVDKRSNWDTMPEYNDVKSGMVAARLAVHSSQAKFGLV